MNILYVTTLWTGFAEVLFDGVVEPKGMPAFLLPLKELVNRGHNVDFILLHNNISFQNYNIKIDWIKEEQIIGQVYWNNNLIMKPINIINLYKKADNIIKNKSYDFIYAHGESATVSRLIAKKYNLPFGQRLYGTFLYDYIKKNGLIKAKIFHFLEYDAFKSEKDFLLITNDGSNGDRAYKVINKARTPSKFYFWHNGIERMHEIPREILDTEYERLNKEPFLFYVARIDRWKRQDEAIKILKMLNDRGYNFKLYIAGQIFNQKYYEELKNMIEELKLDRNVIFMGVINKEQINIMSKLSVCAFSLYDMCNLGNVFHEIFSAGGIIISKNDGSLDYFIEHGKNGFLLNDITEAPEYIETIIKDKSYEMELRFNAKSTSLNKMKTWKERINEEIELIENCNKSDRI